MSVIQVILSIIYVILGVATDWGAQLAESPQTVTGVRTEAVPWKVRWSTLPGMEPLHSCSLPLP